MTDCFSSEGQEKGQAKYGEGNRNGNSPEKDLGTVLGAYVARVHAEETGNE